MVLLIWKTSYVFATVSRQLYVLCVQTTPGKTERYCQQVYVLRPAVALDGVIYIWATVDPWKIPI